MRKSHSWLNFSMAQVKIYGLRELLDPVKQRLSDTIHACVMEALAYPAD